VVFWEFTKGYIARRTDFNAASRLGGSGGGGGGSSGGGGGGGSTGGKPGLGVRSDPSGTKIKSEGGTDAGVPEGSTRKKYVYDPTFVPEYDDDDDDTERIDIDTMNDGWKLERDGFVVTGSKSKEKEKVLSSGTMMPIRLTRVHHETKKAYINIDEDSEIKPKTEEVEGGIDGMEIDEARSSPPPTTTEAAPIKAEADFDDETIAPNKAPAPPSTPSSPESKRKVAKEVKVDPPSSPETKKKARKPELPKSPEAKLSDKKFQRDSTRNEVKPVLQTEEDQAEYDRHLDEMEHLVKELGGVRPPRRPDADGDEFMEDGKEEAFELDGKLFLFQFPPVLPSLYNPKKSSKPENKKSKQETKKAAAAVEISPSKGGKTAKVKNEPETEEKVEPEIVIEEETKLVEEEGWVGKMVVRKSGKVELVWGGTSMVVHAGTAGDFLSTAVVVDGRERPVVNQLREPGEPEGSAVGMGKIFGKYVVVPDWEKLS
jgi:DNA-directed RNA polymerase III subunit RPC4